MRKKKITERFVLKVLAFFVTVLSFCCSVVCVVGIVWMAETGFYTTPFAQLPYVPKQGQGYEFWIWCYNNRFSVITVGVLSAILCILSFIFQLCSAGRVYGKETVEVKGLAAIPFDILTVGVVALGGIFMTVADSWYYGDLASVILVVLLGILSLCVVIGYFLIWAIQSNAGVWWKNMVVCKVLQLVVQGVRFCVKAVTAVLHNLPGLLTAGIGLIGFFIIEILLLAVWGGDYSDIVLLWLIEKVLVIPLVLYVALAIHKLLKGSEALVEGNLSAKVDTKYLIGSFKEQGDNLNSIAQGLNVVVEERMKSERLKTELITNVSHDIKTPLTSIINYADLIVEEPTENGKITEYAEVLKRQSARLKKLIEDLMEASKASTGNIEVNMMPCEVGVLLTQTMGEYEQRLSELGLELIARQPEQPVRIMADGKLLWRVFDNLLNNICKYAMRGTRVYLTVEDQGDVAAIAFKNISRYPLDVSAEDLKERFVRGDKSRHTEGNGLGLSITQSLTQLQGGRLELTVDGDFFKVVLFFEKVVD